MTMVSDNHTTYRSPTMWKPPITHHKFLDFKLSPCSGCCILSFRWFPGLWISYAKVAGHTVASS